MNITQVIVGVHEKRNHPYEYGHYDASVTLTAGVGLNDAIDEITQSLRAQARRHVLEECDDWAKSVKEEKRIADLTDEFIYLLGVPHWNTDDRIERCKGVIEALPKEMRAEYDEKLLEAVSNLPPEEEPRDDYPEVCQQDEEELAFW